MHTCLTIIIDQQFKWQRGYKTGVGWVRVVLVTQWIQIGGRVGQGSFSSTQRMWVGEGRASLQKFKVKAFIYIKK